MRRVTCYECEKRYDYDDDGFCPRCGAFNSPPHASRIGADGALVWIDGLNERNHKNSFVHEELHDEDRERRRLKLDREAPRQVVRLDGAGKRAVVRTAVPGRKKSVSGLVWVILGLVICVNFLLPLIATLFLRW